MRPATRCRGSRRLRCSAWRRRRRRRGCTTRSSTTRSYASFCDVNSTLNCTEAYTSRFGAFGGVPVALFGLLFFAGRAGADRALLAVAGRVAQSAGLSFSLSSTIGLAAVLYLAYASYFILNVVCLLCAGTYVAVIGLFLLSGSATTVSHDESPHAHHRRSPASYSHAARADGGGGLRRRRGHRDRGVSRAAGDGRGRLRPRASRPQPCGRDLADADCSSSSSTLRSSRACR